MDVSGIPEAPGQGAVPSRRLLPWLPAGEDILYYYLCCKLYYSSAYAKMAESRKKMQRVGSWEYGSEFPEDFPYEDEAGDCRRDGDGTGIIFSSREKQILK